MAIQHFTVSGMTCQHCVGHVREEVTSVPGVLEVDVNLDGQMSVASAHGVDFAMIRDAVVEAGNYTVVEA